jgi:hypothetical protein
VTEPDAYDYLGIRPSDDFVISRDHLGDVISLYSYGRWDFSTYTRPTQRDKAITFPIAVDETHKRFVADLKWLTFIFLYHKKGKKRGAAGTLLGRYRLLMAAYTYGLEFGISVCELFESPEVLKDFFYTLSKSRKKQLLSTIRSLSSMAADDLGFTPVSIKSNHIAKLKPGESLNLIRQTAVIPERIYAHCTMDLSNKIIEFNEVSGKICCFLNECISIDGYAKSKTTQRSMGLSKSTFVHDFRQAAEVFGLANYFDKNTVKSLSNFCHHLMLIQFQCKSLIHIYSGMRDEEVLSMKFGCLETVKVKANDVIRLIGVTTKLEKGEERLTYWITCAEVIPAIEAAQAICGMVSSANNISADKMHLFLTPSHLPFSQRHHGLVKLTEMDFVVSNLKHHFYNDETFVGSSYIITAEDHAFLKDIDFSRAWDTEADLEVGKPWPFATHQFRRSLAVYCLSSRLVSLTSLKRQLKHLSMAMTLYYVKGNLAHIGMFNLEQDFKEEVLALKETVSALDYINLALGERRLAGTHGAYIEKNIKLLGEEAILIFREETAKRANRGELHFTNTHMGGCVSSSACGKPLLNPLSSCLHCAKAMIDPECLSRNVEVAEARMSTLPEGPERTTLLGEISHIKRFKSEKA